MIEKGTGRDPAETEDDSAEDSVVFDERDAEEESHDNHSHVEKCEAFPSGDPIDVDD